MNAAPPLERFRALLEKRPHTTEELKRAMDVGERQIRRYKEKLAEAGLTVHSERRSGGGVAYFIAGEDARQERPALALADAEVLALVVALRAGRSILGTTPLAPTLSQAQRTLHRHLAPTVDWIDLEERDGRWHFRAVAQTRIDPDAFRLLLRAVEHEQTVWLDYQKHGKPLDCGRRVDPHGFGVVGNSFVVVAWCHRKQAFRDFSLARVRAARPHPPGSPEAPAAHFQRQPGFDLARYFDQFGAFSPDSDEPYVVRLRVEKRCAPYFREREYHASQDIEHEAEDGSLLVSFEALGNLDELRTFVQGWGTGVTVLEPPKLVALLRREAETLAARYGSPARSAANLSA
jgi:predicted DNA-binding transcriptional regulator YafY